MIVHDTIAPLLSETRLRAAVRQWARESGKRMQAKRKALKMRQSTLAGAAGVSTQTVSKAELGEIVPKDQVRIAIAAALLCEVDEIWPYPQRADIWAQAREIA